MFLSDREEFCREDEHVGTQKRNQREKGAEPAKFGSKSSLASTCRLRKKKKSGGDGMRLHPKARSILRKGAPIRHRQSAMMLRTSLDWLARRSAIIRPADWGSSMPTPCGRRRALAQNGDDSGERDNHEKDIMRRFSAAPKIFSPEVAPNKIPSWRNRAPPSNER